MSPSVWEDHSALLGFTQMNSAHDGVRLGRALFKIVRRLGFAHKVWACQTILLLTNLKFLTNRLVG